MKSGLEAIAFAIIVCAVSYCTVHSNDAHQETVNLCIQHGGNWSSWTGSCALPEVKP